VGLHGCLKHSKSWFNSRSLDHSRQLEKTLGRTIHGYVTQLVRALPQGRGRGFNPLRLGRKLESPVDFQPCPKQYWGMGQSVGQQPLKLFIVSVRSRLPLPAPQVKTWQAKILTSTSASEPKHHGYLSIGAETCGAKARDVAGSNPALRWPRREHHLLEA
jgi:hypothetical protein